MKKYKKLLMVAPLACMLGTGVFTLPNAAHADQPASYWQLRPESKTTYSKENLANELANSGLRYAIENTPELRQKFKIADDERIQMEQGKTSFIDRNGNTTTYPEVYYGLQNQLSKMEIGAKGTSFEVNPTIDSYEDLGQTNLLTINNDDGIEKQTAQTPETTETFSETMSYSNQYGAKLGVESTTAFKVNLPFNLGEAAQTIKISTEFNYSHTDSNTKTQSKAVTFKSQPVVAAPGGTTTYYGTIKRAKFSGTFQTDAYLSGVTLKLPIVKKDGNGSDVVHTEEVTLTSEDIYTIYKNKPTSIPSYLSFDDQNKKVIVNKAEFKFSGEGGYYSAIQIRFTPKDPNKSTQVMPYKEYIAKAQQGTL
ncbi:ETX/MTX2 family pore-forming toxin [Bacillus mycoides]|uniref:ETX/MTX2 family pore-forming toxin n=1 Tax=Bacillus mycoides TaxID=1405 RepID=UPI0025A235D8|nr:ETX/MTX2 family pore-forming toxin [Bacillus mycoides]MDM5431096.1 ETX/MTX2 family pore-forming toxin [Bacillus mycoides]